MTDIHTRPDADSGTARDADRAAVLAATAEAKLQALHDRLLVALDELTCGTGWQQMLRTAAALPTYSPHNVLLITSQHPHATAVAGFHTWKHVGRAVRKGEKGIAILAPMLTNKRDRDTGTDSEATAGSEPSPGPTANSKASPLKPRRLVGFRVVHVFDISQTDGPDLPEAPRPVLLDGQAPPGLLDGLTQQIQEQGFQLVRHDFDIPHPGQGSPNGVTDYLARTVLVRPDLTEAQTAKTLAHELGHVLLHAPTRRPAALTREQAEVEAESVAYIVTAAHGLDSGTYTIPYVAGWSGGDRQLVADTAGRVLSTAHDILTRTPAPPTHELSSDTRQALRTAEAVARKDWHKTAPQQDRTRPHDRPGQVTKTAQPGQKQMDQRASGQDRLW